MRCLRCRIASKSDRPRAASASNLLTSVSMCSVNLSMLWSHWSFRYSSIVMWPYSFTSASAMLPLLLLLLLLPLLSSCAAAASSTVSASVYYEDEQYVLVLDRIDPRAAAFGWWDDSVNRTGWATLVVNTTDSGPAEVQAFAAGFLEGALTARRISQMYNTFMELDFHGKAPSAALMHFIRVQLAYIRRNAAEQGASSAFWRQVGYVVQQVSGLQEGYTSQVNHLGLPALTFEQLWLLNNYGDLETLEGLFKSRVAYDGQVPLRYVDCSAFVKVLADENGNVHDVMAGHTTWTAYGSMLRVYKYYNMPLDLASVQSVGFSSRPGMLSSKDDFYQTSAGLVTMETTNGVLNHTLDKLIVPNTVPTWIRVNVANRLTTNGADWVATFAEQNSGTYNNQWMVIDYKRINAQSGLLWVLEQIPGSTEQQDVTATLLRDSYWASYNIPFFERIYNASGFPAYREKYGDQYSYTKCPRAQIFKQQQQNVSDLDAFAAVLRYNDWRHDPLQLGNPAYAISSRYDLLSEMTPPTRKNDAFGGIDTKVTNAAMMADRLTVSAQSGPTTSHGQPPFSWSQFPTGVPHYGQPETFNFSFVEMSNQ
eukprot:TRINITY_DN66667_c5_g3_i2.p1 TRINITY_DN66667_c5_g3~~TRINITY_DN66667_c5_g3_i2.p1  ORF type:complete len:594 (+),score=266.34 TRINITY_DN66667_c5_g3_i2:1060-2841(+)